VSDPVLAARPFDVCGELPTGVTVLEASAGTGKTYAIAALAARYVADGVPLDQLLLVTFTRMATSELRDRVRERLVQTERALGDPSAERDDVAALLATGSPEAVAARRANLGRALADFDAATIATTHGFCQEVLSGLGVVGDVEPDAELVEEVEDLVREVVDDLYVRRFRHDAEPPAITRAEAGKISREVVRNPMTPIVPEHPPADSIAEMRVRLANAVREELDRRKRAAGVMTYDDLLTRLADTLAGPNGPDAIRRLRERYAVVLVDEFQDTDPIQWGILRRAFGEGDVTLVLIGDPKQAIYAFRGADVYAYLDAAATAGARATLEVNWRSDQGLIEAYDALWSGARLGHEGIAYRRVRAAEANVAPRLTGAPVGAPLRIRVVHREDPDIEPTQRGYAGAPSARERIATDLAADVVRLLESGAEREERLIDGTPCGRERIEPGDVAVLVRTNRQAVEVRDALDRAHVPAVVNGAGSVFATSPARDWLRLLEALERPAHSMRARAAALTPFLGWQAADLAGADEARWEELHRRLHAWARLLRVKGVAALAETITLSRRLPETMLHRPDGERQLTDLRHVGQLLHSAATAETLGASALTAWLRRRITAAEEESGDEERARRLESDAEAVQVLTVHRAKGLEFPVVYLPFLWDQFFRRDHAEPVTFHDSDVHDTRTIDVALEGEDFAAHRRQAEEEQRGEDLRLAYVALTRAQHQAVVWWAGSAGAGDSALGRLVFSMREDGTIPPNGGRTPTDAAAVARFESLRDLAPDGCVHVERSALPDTPASWAGEPPATEALGVSVFDRDLDRRWRRTSFSDITSGVHDALVASEPEGDADIDEGPVEAPPPVHDEPLDLLGDRLRAVPSLLATMGAGVRVGTFVHRVLEVTDFAAPDLDAELAAHVHRFRGTGDVGEPADVVAGLRAALETPLGPILGGRALREIPRADRLDEVTFELPLVGGDTPRGRVSMAALGARLRTLVADDDPLAGTLEHLGDPALRPTVRGYLTGSLDLVVRIPGSDGEPRFAIADYKTNWLARPDEALSAWHHRPEALRAEMERFHYGLQALLYTAALHRYLRWRLRGYDPGRHLAGVLYLFLRGMTGPGTPEVDGGRCGVFAWRPSSELVVALSDALDEGVEA
jgi:exodeoxyribonuclease V beta subunit